MNLILNLKSFVKDLDEKKKMIRLSRINEKMLEVVKCKEYVGNCIVLWGYKVYIEVEGIYFSDSVSG